LQALRRGIVSISRYNLQNLHSADLHVQGILGEDFLEQFDLAPSKISVVCFRHA
jgi:hypothetical protein